MIRQTGPSEVIGTGDAEEGAFIKVTAELVGDLAHTNVAGSPGGVSGICWFQCHQQSGSVRGPIICQMHKLSRVDSTQTVYDSVLQLRSESGSLLGDLRMNPGTGAFSERGVIRQVEFPGGTIGADEAHPVEILADGLIDVVRAKEIHALIRGTNSEPADIDRDSFVYLIGQVETLTGTPSTSGEFTGEIRAYRQGKDPEIFFSAGYANMRFRGDMKGRIWLQELESSTFPHQIQISTQDLKGTISMSAFDPGAGTSVWDGPVLLDAGPMGSPAAITMTGPIDGDGYTRLAATLGGGAVGLVPFQTHTSDCFPAAFVAPSASFTLHPNSAPAPSKPIVIRHFGPVRLPELPDTAFTIEARLLDEPDSWVDVTSCFTESLDVPGTAVLLTPTNLLPGGFEYRVIQNKDEKGDNLLLCDLPDPLRPQAPVVDFPLEFRFEVCDEVPLGDASSDGIVNFADITAVLANFNATGCLLLGDANKDGVVNFADITEVLADFNFVYCGNVAQSVGAKGGVAANHMDLGEEAPMSAADAANMVLSALAAMGYPSIEAFADAFAQMRAAEQTAEIQQLGQLLQGSP